MTRITSILMTLVLFTSPSLALAAEEGEHGYSIFGDLSFWTLITFIGFVFAIKKLGWQGFVDGMNERERKENEAIALAEDKNRKSQQELSDRKGQLEAIGETSQGFIEEAHRDAQHTRKDIVTSARNEAETLKHRALREIERTRDQSLKELFDTTASRVVERTEQRLREQLSGEDQERLMDEALAEFAAGSTS